MTQTGNARTTQPGNSKTSDGSGGRRTGSRRTSVCRIESPSNASTGRKSKASGPNAIAAGDGTSSATPTSLGRGAGAVWGGVGATSAKNTGRAVGVAGGIGIGKAVAAVKPRLRSRTTSCAMAPATSLGVEEDIQGMVDKIKSRNRNNGGGRQAKGGRWTRRRCCLLFFRREDEYAIFVTLCTKRHTADNARGQHAKCVCGHRWCQSSCISHFLILQRLPYPPSACTGSPNSRFHASPSDTCIRGKRKTCCWVIRCRQLGGIDGTPAALEDREMTCTWFDPVHAHTHSSCAVHDC